MAIDSENTNIKNLSLSGQVSNKFRSDTIPEDRVLIHNYKSLIRIAKDQIKHYINQIGYHPEKKSLYIKKINEIIISEFSHGRGLIKNE